VAGRQWRTGQINLAMLVRLTSEFQGFARDLHDEASGVLAVAIADGDPVRESILRAAFTRERTLDRGNPHPAGLGKDFLAIGMELWPDLTAASPDAKTWNTRLDQLVRARNAIAHDDVAKLRKLETDGVRIHQFQTFMSYRMSIRRLVETMDTVVMAHCQSV
jgi:hypothetical protein